MTTDRPALDDAARQELYLIADELRGVGNQAMRFATDFHERERGGRAMELAERVRRLAAHDQSSRPTTPAAVSFDLVDEERISPLVGAGAVVLDPDGRILLARRRDNGAWCTPGGLCEIGQSPPEAALRELWEEAGVRGEVERLLGIFDSRRWGSRATSHILHLEYLVRAEQPRPEPGAEMLETAFFAADALPSPFHPGHGERVPYLLELARTDRTHHDPADTRTGDLPMHQRP